jgi:hypothetical protein
MMNETRPRANTHRKSPGGRPVMQNVRYLLLIAVGAVLVWLVSLLWSMLQGTGNVF